MYLHDVKSTIDFTDSLMSVVYTLYGIHKGYEGIEDEYHSLRFLNDSDKLLTEIYQSIKKPKRNELFYLYKDLSFYHIDDFENSYKDILKDISGLFSLDSRVNAEFFTPSEITSLLSYFVITLGCQSIFDPFCGTSSIVHEFQSLDVTYEGQEWSSTISLISRINIEAHYGKDDNIKCCDSIQEWNYNHFDAIATCPPLNMRLSLNQKMQGSIYSSMSSNLEEMLFTRAFEINKANTVIVLLPMSFTYDKSHSNLRKYLVENNYLDTVIQLPHKLLYQSSTPCVVVIARQNRPNDIVRFVNAIDFVYKEGKNNGNLNVEEFVKYYEDDKPPVSVRTDNNIISKYSYILNPLLYVEGQNFIGGNQVLYPLNELIQPIHTTRYYGQENVKLFPISNFKSDFISIITTDHVVESITKAKGDLRTYKVLIPRDSSCYLLCHYIQSEKPKYALYKSRDIILCPPSVIVYEINETVVLPFYLIYLLTSHAVLKTGFGTIKDYLTLSVGVDRKERQGKIIEKEIQTHNKNVELERRADKKRLKIKTNISDLEHMLGTTQIKVNNILSRMERIKPDNEKYKGTLKQLQDNIDYLFRMIHFDNAKISEETFDMREQNLNHFIEAYVNSWNNYGGGIFELTVKNEIEEEPVVMFDKNLMIVMLDAILSNAARHGFNKNKHHTASNHVEIVLGLEIYEGNPYVILKIQNNGDPFKEGFTIRDYIMRGKYAGKNGRTGLGGHHVYEVVKGHNGYLYLDSNKVWNVIIEVLLPVGVVNVDNLNEYEHECI